MGLADLLLCFCGAADVPRVVSRLKRPLLTHIIGCTGSDFGPCFSPRQAAQGQCWPLIPPEAVLGDSSYVFLPEAG